MTRTNNRQTISVVLKCKNCSSEQTIRRRMCRKKKKKHKKTLYCINCRKKTVHEELGSE